MSRATADLKVIAGCWPDRKVRTVVATFTVPGNPVAKARPRWDPRRGGKPVTPEATRDAEGTVGWRFRQQVGPFTPDRSSRFGLRLLFVAGDAVHRDTDNMLKLVKDALNGLLWGDDSQVDEECVQRIRGENPRTEVTVFRIAEPGLFD